jgi:glycerol-3-phosphate acyltransferase PlsY
MKYLIVAIASFLIGGIPFGYIIAKLRGIDIRQIGSGNIGAVNVFRSTGPAFGGLTLVLDGLKGFVPTILALNTLDLRAGVLAAIFAFLGHVFTPYLRFKGGKGVATGLGGFLALTPLGVAVGVLCWVLVVVSTGYASLGSMIGTLVIVLFLLFTRADPWILLASLLIFLFIVIRHRGNIGRLRAGTERRIRFGRRS